MQFEDIPSEIIKQLIDHCHEHSEEEQCGLITLDYGEDYVIGEVVFGSNADPNPSTKFKLDPVTAATAYRLSDEPDGYTVIVWHSHTAIAEAGDNWSPMDIVSASQGTMPWLLIHGPTGRTRFFDPCESLPYEGREWNVYTHNCETLLRDYYREEFGIELMQWIPSEPRPWEKAGWDEYREQLIEHGFEMLGTPMSGMNLQRGDVALMRLGRAVAPNHAAIVTESGDILHHLINRRSCIEPYSQEYRDATYSIYRHPAVKGEA
jgi:proteasome lid subunit RPN8/RPN11